MPKAISITKEMIVEAAFDIVRAEGFVALSARNVSKKIGCSTQPIYCTYQNMEDLKQDVIGKMEHHLHKIISEYRKSGEPFLDYGLGYIHAAYVEPVLFKEIYVDNILNMKITDLIPHEEMIEVMRSDESTSALSDDKLREIAVKGWIFVHGLASLVASGMLIYNADKVQEMVSSIFDN